MQSDVMNSYFTNNPFLHSLQGEPPQGPVLNGGGGGCASYGRGGGGGGVYDPQSQYNLGGCAGGAGAAAGQPMTIAGPGAGGAGEYGTHSPPGAHPAVSEPCVSRHQDLSAYDNGQTHLGGPPPPHQGGWGMPQGAQHSPTYYHHQTQLPPDPHQQQAQQPYHPATSTPHNANSSTPSIPFYPWMGVVGMYHVFLLTIPPIVVVLYG